MLQAMLIAGTESSSATIEWAMSLLLNHPEAMYKAWTEISADVVEDKLLDETDLPKLKRACPGAVLAQKVVRLVLGALIQSFEWNRIGYEEIDMGEGTGLTMPKAEPLVALCKPRPDMINLFSTL
ncbi:hypothetical protein REPUB_Repub02eG0056700 [Reevesia pubescens]